MSKNHDAIPVPTPEVYARPLGKFQWTCPNCHQEFPLSETPWQRAEIKCSRCFNRFRLGLGFNFLDAPYALFCGKWNGYTGNRLNPSGSYAEARVMGAIEWRCPQCQTQQETTLLDKALHCNSCTAVYIISLLIYRAAKVFKVRCPIDWVFPKHAQITNNPIPVETSSPSAGTSSSRSGGAS